jgi:hypothetical protein
MAKYTSSVFWYDYRDIEKQSNGDYSAQLSDNFQIDLVFNKWFWNRKIKVDLVFRNLFNRQHITYPIGASLDLRFYVRAEMFFNF